MELSDVSEVSGPTEISEEITQPIKQPINNNDTKKRKSPVRDAIIFSLILVVVLTWCYTLYLWMLCCFDWNNSVYKSALSSIVTSSIIVIIAIIVIIVISRLIR